MVRIIALWEEPCLTRRLLDHRGAPVWWDSDGMEQLPWLNLQLRENVCITPVRCWRLSTETFELWKWTDIWICRRLSLPAYSIKTINQAAGPPKFEYNSKTKPEGQTKVGLITNRRLQQPRAPSKWRNTIVTTVPPNPLFWLEAKLITTVLDPVFLSEHSFASLFKRTGSLWSISEEHLVIPPLKGVDTVDHYPCTVLDVGSETRENERCKRLVRGFTRAPFNVECGMCILEITVHISNLVVTRNNCLHSAILERRLNDG
jgi:hypothetical protein